jgi:20S proteasome alpha/beta subunit
MTTIAYRDGIMAADTRSCMGDWIGRENVQKIHRLPNGEVAGITGDLLKGFNFVKWLQGSVDQRPDLGDTTRVIVLHFDSSLTIYESIGEYNSSPDFSAWGSGMPPALAALYCGKTAAEAVGIAALIDPWTGGDLVVMKCELPEFLAASIAAE